MQRRALCLRCQNSSGRQPQNQMFDLLSYDENLFTGGQLTCNLTEIQVQLIILMRNSCNLPNSADTIKMSHICAHCLSQ